MIGSLRRRIRRADREPAHDPVLRGLHGQAAHLRRLSRLGGDRDRRGVVGMLDDEIAVIAAAQPQRVARAHRRTRVDDDELHAGPYGYEGQSCVSIRPSSNTACSERHGFVALPSPPSLPLTGSM